MENTEASIQDFLLNKKIEKLNFRQDELNTVQNILLASPEHGFKFVKNMKTLPKYFKLKGFSFNDQVFSESDIIRMNQDVLNIDNGHKKEDFKLIKNAKKHDFNLDIIYSLIEKKKIYRNLIKQKNIDFSFEQENLNTDNEKNYRYQIEMQNDKIEKAIIESNANKLKRSLLSNKYKVLANAETDEIFLELSKQGVTRSQLQESVAPKLAAVKNSYELNSFIENALGLNIVWDLSYFNELANEHHLDILSNEDGVLHIEINNFKESNLLGSKMWCITRDENFLKEYLHEDNSRIIFRFDMNKDIKDKESYIAMIYQGNKLIDIYDKNDHAYKKEDELFQKINEFKPNKLSDESSFKKLKSLEYFLQDKDDVVLTNQFVLNLLDVKAFHIIDSIKHNARDEFMNFEVYGSERNQELFFNALNNYDFEQFNYIYKNSFFDKFTSSYSDTKLETFSRYLKNENDPSNIDKAFNIAKDKISKINVRNLRDISSLVYAKNKSVVKDNLSHYNISFADLISSIKNNITFQDLKQIEYVEPDFIKNAFDKNAKKSFVSLISNNLLEKDELNYILNKIDRSNETIENLITLNGNRIKRCIKEGIPIDKKDSNFYDLICVEPKQKHRNKNRM